jgi:hypothetical protein
LRITIKVNFEKMVDTIFLNSFSRNLRGVLDGRRRRLPPISNLCLIQFNLMQLPPRGTARAQEFR